jgi:hypothetical protein
LRTLGRAGAPTDLLKALEDWSADQMRWHWAKLSAETGPPILADLMSV